MTLRSPEHLRQPHREPEVTAKRRAALKYRERGVKESRADADEICQVEAELERGLLTAAGPGAGTPPYAHRFFDPEAFHIITYDQRGAGKSKPYAGIEDNDPNLLVADLDRLREHLGFEKWHVAGGSWGSTRACSAIRKALAFSAPVPSTAAGSGIPQCAVIGLPGQ